MTLELPFLEIALSLCYADAPVSNTGAELDLQHNKRKRTTGGANSLRAVSLRHKITPFHSKLKEIFQHGRKKCILADSPYLCC